MGDTPPPPAGYALDNQIPPPPPGYAVDPSSQMDMVPSADGSRMVPRLSIAPPKPSLLTKFGMGMGDTGLGLVQAMARMPTGGDTPLPQPDAGLTQRASQQIDQTIKSREQDFQAQRKASGDTGVEWMRALGAGVAAAPVSAMLPEIAAPKAATGFAARIAPELLNGAFQGGTMAALNPVTDTGQGDYESQKLKQIGIGSGLGGANSLIFNRLGAAINPTIDSNVQYLRARGVNPTVGQNIGPGTAMTEDVSKTINPMVSLGQRRAVKEFNVAAYNEVLKPIGESFSGDPGREGVRVVGDKLSDAYNQLVPNLRMVPDEQMMTDLGNVTQHKAIMSEQAAKQFDSILENTMPRGPLQGEPLKRLQSKLTLEISRFGRSPDPNHQMISDALSDVRTAVMDNLARVNPQQAERLTAIDHGWANLVRLEHAASASNHDGIFTPVGLLQASRSAEDSVRRRAIGRGMGGDMQKLADAGIAVLGNSYPNSGTATRAAMLSVPALIAGGTLNLPAALGVGATGLAYTPMGQKALGSLISGSRGKYAADIADLTKKSSLPVLSSLMYGVIPK